MSLGDYARSVRKDEKPASAKKYDNDNLPTADNISVVGNATDSTGPEDANPAPDANAANPADGAATPESKDDKKDDAADAQKVNDQWKQKIADQQGKIDLLSARTGCDAARISPARRPRSMPTPATACAARLHGTRKTPSTNSRLPRSKRQSMTPRKRWTI